MILFLCLKWKQKVNFLPICMKTSQVAKYMLALKEFLILSASKYCVLVKLTANILFEDAGKTPSSPLEDALMAVSFSLIGPSPAVPVSNDDLNLLGSAFELGGVSFFALPLAFLLPCSLGRLDLLLRIFLWLWFWRFLHHQIHPC